MKTAVIYTRVSTGKQADGLSTSVQKDVCEDHCKRERLKVLEVFEDAKSGTTIRRPEFQKMLRFCKDRRVDFLVVHDMTRFSRGEDDAIALVELQSHGTRLRSAMERVIDETPMGKKIRRYAAADAAYHSDEKRVLTMERMNAAIRYGGWPWKVPIGYVRSPKLPRMPATIEADQSGRRAELVAEIFHLYAAGKTKARILDKVVADGLRYRRSGKAPTKQTIDEILRNPVYAGKTYGVDQKTKLPFEVEGLHEALVSRELFDRVQARLNGKKLVERGDSNPSFPLTAFAHCGACKRALRGYQAKKKYPWYDCKYCKRVSASGKKLHVAFLEFLAGMELDETLLKGVLEVVADVWKQKNEETAKTAKRRKAELEALELRLSAIQERIILRDFGSMPSKVFEDEWHKLNNQVDKVRTSLNQEFGDITLEDVRMYSNTILTHASLYWQRADEDAKRAFQKAIFPSGVLVSPELVFDDVRTDLSTSFYCLLRQIKNKSEVWRPQGDSNPCYRRERAVS